MSVRVAPSLLSSDFGRMAEVIRETEAAGADWIHFDVMDGRFVPNLTIGPLVVGAARKVTHAYLDVHLMVESPESYVNDFAVAGASGFTFQAEAVNHRFRLVQAVHQAGMRAGIAICPGTPIVTIEPILPVIDLVLIMTVDPGFGGQKFIPSMVSKVKDAARLIEKSGFAIDLEVDGGVDPTTAVDLISAGASVLVAGSSIYGSGLSIAAAIQSLKGMDQR